MRRTITTALLAALAVLAVAGMAVPAVAQSPNDAALNETLNFTNESDSVQNVTVDVEFSDPGNVTVYPVAASNQSFYLNSSGTVQELTYTKGDYISPAIWNNATVGVNSSQFDAYTVTVWESGTLTTPYDVNIVNGTLHANFTANTTNPDGSNDTAALETLVAQKGDSSSGGGGIIGAISSAGTERIAGFLFVVGIIWVGWKRGFFDR